MMDDYINGLKSASGSEVVMSKKRNDRYSVCINQYLRLLCNRAEARLCVNEAMS